jgi:hypothetical protein
MIFTCCMYDCTITITVYPVSCQLVSVERTRGAMATSVRSIIGRTRVGPSLLARTLCRGAEALASPQSLSRGQAPRKFGALRVRPWLASSLHQAGFTAPTAVQAASMDRIAHHRDTVIHAETGSGKTLAYLVPLLSRLDRGVPLQLLILVPSRELALQVAHDVDRLLVPESGLHMALAVSVGTEEAGASSPHGLQQVIAAEVDACRANVLIATPPALFKVLRTPDELTNEAATKMIEAVRERTDHPRSLRKRYRPREPAPTTPLDGPAGDGVRLLIRLATNLDAIVIDEVDALLPKPILNSDVSYYRQKDWANADRLERRSVRPGGVRSSTCAKLLQRIMHATRAMRDPRELTLPAGGSKRGSRPEGTGPADRLIHVVAASATISRGILLQLQSLFGMACLPAAVGPEGHVRKGSGVVPERRRGRTGIPTRPTGARGVAGVRVPSAIDHRVHAVAAGESTVQAVSHALRAIGPKAALVVLPDDASLRSWARELEDAGLPQVDLLHEVLGFPSRRTARGGLTAPAGSGMQQVTAGLLEAVDEVRSTRAREAAWGDQSRMRVLLTTERSTRGIDLPNLECVVMAYLPATSDVYTHLAGRTGRAAARGTAVLVLAEEELPRLGLFTSQLGISIKKLQLTED